jgi:hypothetical protein
MTQDHLLNLVGKCREFPYPDTPEEIADEAKLRSLGELLQSEIDRDDDRLDDDEPKTPRCVFCHGFGHVFYGLPDELTLVTCRCSGGRGGPGAYC